MSASTLVEFVLARITEDEEVALAGISGQADPENGWGYIHDGVSRGALTPHVGHIHEPVQAAHITRWHPQRVLDECKAKREIVEDFNVWVNTDGGLKVLYDPIHSMVAKVLLRGVSHLALPYANHSNYQQEWA